MTHVGLFARVDANVFLEVLTEDELLAAEAATIWLLASVDLRVPLQQLRPRKLFATHTAYTPVVW